MKNPLLVLGMMFVSSLAMAAAPDFNGSWIRNPKSSDPAPNAMYWTTRLPPGGMGGGPRNVDIILTVHQDGKNMHVAESQSVVRDYTLDGSPHTRATDTGIQKAVVTAQVEGDSLVIDTTEPYGGMPGNATLKIKQVWVLSPDGKTLTITTTRDVPARQQTFKEVYNRTQAQSGAICSAGCVVPK